jgi:glycosyltransferase involved in cell wall biosynthesis
MELSVVIPCYNEAASLPALLTRVEQTLAALPPPCEVIVINDGSTDESARVLGDIAASRPWLKIMNLRRNYGQTAAMMAGFEHATGGIIVTLDGDLQNDPADIARLVARLQEGYDLVSGWRPDRKDPLARRLLSRLANGLISCATGVRLHDYGCSLKAYRREVLEDVHLYGEMHRFIPVYAKWNGARITELPVTHHPRTAGVSKYGMDRIVKVMLDLFVVLFLHRYAQKPIYVFGACGLLSFAVSFLAGLAALYYKFYGGKTFVQTPLPLLWATMFFTGVLFLLLGLIAEVGNRTYHESQGKRTYRVASTVNLPREGGR